MSGSPVAGDGAASAPTRRPHAVIVMGVSAAGKSAIGKEVARGLRATFLDADDYHPEANVAKMRAGTPLTDEDRAPWLAAVGAAIAAKQAAGEGVVMACSALKRAYRQVLADAVPGLRFVYLEIAPEVVEERLTRRRGHFFNPALGASQFKALEPPTHEELPGLIVVDAARAFRENVESVLEQLAAGR